MYGPGAGDTFQDQRTGNNTLVGIEYNAGAALGLITTAYGLKLWDLSKFNMPLATEPALICMHPALQTGCGQ